MVNQIKQRVNEIMNDQVKMLLIKICFIIMLFGMISNFFSLLNSTFASFLAGVATILLIPIGHGEIVAALKVVRNNSASLTVDDAYTGIRRFRELFTTYLIRDVIEAIAMMFVIIIATVVFIGMNASTLGMLTSTLSTLESGNVGVISNVLIQYMSNTKLLMSLLIISVIVIVALFVIELYFFAVPYLLEQYRLKNMKAISTSMHLIKGHVVDLIKLELSFLPKIIICAIASGVISFFLNAITSNTTVISILSSLLTALLSCYIYYPQYILSKAIFFEEISYNKL